MEGLKRQLRAVTTDEPLLEQAHQQRKEQQAKQQEQEQKEKQKQEKQKNRPPRGKGR